MKAYYRNGSMVEDKDGNIGHLEKITSSGATFVPLIEQKPEGEKQEQKEEKKQKRGPKL